MRKKFFCLMMAIFTLTLINRPVFASSEIVEFEDEKVEQEVRMQLRDTYNLYDPTKVISKEDKITVSDMENLKRIKIGPIFDENFDPINAKSLKGLEKATNLESLHLSSLHCKDVTPIENLKKLKSINITYNDLENLDFLKGFENLETIKMDSNEIKNLDGIKELTNLKHITLTNNKIEDLSALSELKNLEELYLDKNNISDLGPLKELTGLRELSLNDNKIKDISALENLTELTMLYMNGVYTGPYDAPDDSGNAISNIEPLRNLKKLTKLHLQDLVYIEDLSPLAELTNLESLILRGNKISNIEPLRNLTKLEVLYLYKNNVSDISALENMTEMGELNFAVNKVKDISPLKNLNNLYDLKGYSNNITDLSPIKDSECYTINFNDNEISDFSAFKDRVNREYAGNLILELQRVERTANVLSLTKNDNTIEYTVENPIRNLDGKPYEIDGEKLIDLEDYPMIDDKTFEEFVGKNNEAVKNLAENNIKVKSDGDKISIAIPKDKFKDEMVLDIPFVDIRIKFNDDFDMTGNIQTGGILTLKLNNPEKPEPQPNPSIPDPKPETKPENKTFEGVELQRQSGKDRYKTAVEISKKNFKSSETVILVNGMTEADALSASVLAKEKNAPILLIKKDSIPEEVKQEIERLGAKNIIVIGGNSSVSKRATKDLKQKVETIAGKDRFETAVKIAKAAGKTDKLVIANGITLVDALTASSIAQVENRGIILVKEKEIPQAAKEVIENAKDILIVGGKSSVNLPLEADRISGKDRFETAVKIAERAFKNPKQVALANSTAYADALVFGAVTEKTNAPILLTRKDSLPDATKAYLEKNKPEKVYILGGEDSINTSLFK